MGPGVLGQRLEGGRCGQVTGLHHRAHRLPPPVVGDADHRGLPHRHGGVACVELGDPRLELLGDTSIVLGSGDGQFTMQDALYQFDEERYLDLMLVSLPGGVNIDAAMRALLEYMATDVMATASVVLGIRAANAEDAAHVDSMLRAAFMNAVECGGMEGADRNYRVFFGPSARTRCTAAEQIEGPADVVTARVSVGLQY